MKKIFSLIIAVLLAYGLLGCAGSNKTLDNGSNSSSGTLPTQRQMEAQIRSLDIYTEPVDFYSVFTIPEILVKKDNTRFSPLYSGEGRGGNLYLENPGGYYDLNIYHYKFKGSDYNINTVSEDLQRVLKMNFSGDDKDFYNYSNTIIYAKLANIAALNRPLDSGGNLIVNVSNISIDTVVCDNFTCLGSRYYPQSISLGNSRDDIPIEIAVIMPVGDYITTGSDQVQEVYDFRARTTIKDANRAWDVIKTILNSFIGTPLKGGTGQIGGFILKDGVLTKYTGNAGEVVIPNDVKIIGEQAFFECKSLISVTIPDTVTAIEKNTFIACDNLTNIVIGRNVTVIGANAFTYCRSLTSVIIPDGITRIDYQTFGGCNSLKSVIIPNSVTVIDGKAFEGCKSLTDIEIPDSVITIHDNAFRDCSSLSDETKERILQINSNAEF